MAKKKTAAERAAERRTVMYLRFAALYVGNGRNATQAYRSTHPGVAANSAATNGGEWLRNTEVQNEIARLTAEAWKAEHLTAEEVLGRMARITRKDMGDYYWKPGELDSAQQTTAAGTRKPLHELTAAQRECIEGLTIKDGVYVYEMASKQQQLSTVAKHLKLLSDRVDVNLTMSLDKMIESSYGGNEEA